MDKENVKYTCNGIFYSQKKEEILPFVTAQADLEDIISELSQTQMLYGLTQIVLDMWNLK